MTDTTDSLVDWLYETTMDTAGIGDRITYAIGGLNPRQINAVVEHRDKTEAYAGAQITDQEMTVEVLKRDVPLPSASDRITLPRRAIIVAPRDWTSDNAAKSWIIYVKRTRA